MTFSKTLTAVMLAGALTVGGLSAVATAVGAPDTAWAAHHKGKSMCERGKSGKHGKYGHARSGKYKDSNTLAQRLAAVETEIGIRAEQLDDWRDFTDALQATMKRPSWGSKWGSSTEPFARADALADRAIERAENAEKLKAAIAKLRTTLTPEQLEKVQAIEERKRKRMAKIHGWKHGGKSSCPKAAKSGDAKPAASPSPDKDAASGATGSEDET